MDVKTLIKYAKNQCNPEEFESVVQWLMNEADTPEGQTLLHEVFNNEISDKTIFNFENDRILDRIHHTLNTKQSIEILSDESLGIINKKKFLHLFTSFLTRAAAILFLPFFLYSIYAYFSNKRPSFDQIEQISQLNHEIFAPLGSVLKVDLPDGSKAWLNNGSKLQFPSKFTGAKRIVELEGEGYFEVTLNQKKPFIVNTKKIKVIALGTKFNVMAYLDDPNIEASLKEGKVLVQKKDSIGKYHTLKEMKPREHLSFNPNNGKYSVQIKDPDEFNSWINGKIIFRNTPLDQVARKLSRWYNVEFNVLDKDLEQYSYTATLIDETLPQVLELMKLATPIDYSISQRREQQDGSYSKKKVLLWKKSITH